MDFYKEWLGIPEGPRPPNHYELLRVVQFEDDANKIRAHYKKLNAHVRKYATGKYSDESQELLNEMAKAMLCLTDTDRKRDYDESLGREFEAETDALGRQAMLDILCQQGAITREQKREAEEFASRRGLSHRDAVVQMKLVDPSKAAQALAIQLGFSFVDLEDMLPEDDALDLVPRSLVKHHKFIPLFVDDGKILIACVDEPEYELEDELRLRYGVPVRPVIVAPRSLNQAITQYYSPGMRDEAKTLATSPATKSSSASSKKTSTSKETVSDPKGKIASTSFGDLPPDEQAQRKQYGILFICWSLIVPMLPQILKSASPSTAVRLGLTNFGLVPNLVLAAMVCGGVSFWVTQKYWK